MPEAERLSLLHRLELASHGVDRLMGDALEQDGLPALDAHAILVIGERGRMPLAEVREGLARNGSTMTSLVDRLADRGLIRRVRAGADRRALDVEITDAGSAVAASIRR